jgi:hypothetical protein
VTTTCKIMVKKPLLLLPLTQTINFASKQSKSWLMTDIVAPGRNSKGEEEVVVLSPCFVDPIKATKVKPAVVEFFWLVRRSSDEKVCNMALSTLSVVLGAGVTVKDETLNTKTVGKLSFPVMVSTKAIAADQELVCYYKVDEEPKIKKAKVSAS